MFAHSLIVVNAETMRFKKGQLQMPVILDLLLLLFEEDLFNQ